MKSHVLPASAVLLLLVGSGVAAQAQAAPDPTLADAVAAVLLLEAQQSRPDALRRQGAAVRLQSESLVAADPALSVKHLNDRFNRDTGYTEWEAGIELPLWLPGQRDDRRAVASALEQEADQMTSLLRWDAAGRVREAAWSASIAGRRKTLAKGALESAGLLEADVRKRVAAGELARVDLLLAGKETLAREVELQAARTEDATNREAYRQLTGLERLPSPLAEGLSADNGTLAAHPRLAAAAARVQRARAERDRTLGERRDNPTLTLGGKRQRDDRDADAFDTLGLEIRLPLGLSSQAAPRAAEAELRLTDSEAEMHLVGREIALAVAAARLERSGSVEALQVAERQQALAADTLRLTRRAFNLGETDLINLLRAQQQAFEAELSAELRRLEQQRAVARYNQALGVVPL